MMNFKKVLLLILIVTLLPSAEFCFSADNTTALRPPLATSKTAREFMEYNQGKTMSDIIQALDSRNDVFWRHLRHDNVSRQIMSERLKFLVETKKLPELVKNELRRMKDLEEIDVSDKDIDDCVIFIFGDYLWCSKKDTPNDLDIIIFVGNSKIMTRNVNFNIGLPTAVLNIRERNFLDSTEVRKTQYAMFRMSLGAVIYGEDLFADRKISAPEIIKFAEGLIAEGKEYDQPDIEGTIRREWKRFFLAYLYLHYLFSENIPEAVREISERFLDGQDIGVYIPRFYKGDIAKLPWDEAEAEIKIFYFGQVLQKRLKDLISVLEQKKLTDSNLATRTAI